MPCKRDINSYSLIKLIYRVNAIPVKIQKGCCKNRQTLKNVCGDETLHEIGNEISKRKTNMEESYNLISRYSMQLQ